MFLRSLVSRFLQSDAVASDLDALQRNFDTYYRNHLGLVRSVVRSFGFRDASHDDLVQATFVKAWEHLASLENPKAFPGWIKSIARNTCLETLRRTKKTIAVSSSGEISHDDDGPRRAEIVLVAEGPDDADLHWEHSIELLKAVIATQKAEPRTTVAKMFYFEEKSIKEISAALDMKQNTVLSHLRRFRLIVGDALTTMLEEEEL